MNPLDRINQLTERAENAEKQADMALSNCEAAQRAVAELREENRQLRRSVDELRAQVETARQELARDSATIAKLAKDKQDIWLRCDSGDELLNAILLWIEADMRQTPPPAESIAAFFLPTFCKNTRAHLSRHA